MAEGFARHLCGKMMIPYSAGTVAKGLDSYAVRVMREVGIDISGNRSKTIDEVAGIKFDYVITVCSDADEACPVFPAKTKVIHHGFDDPPKLAINAKNEEEILSHYRRIRDEICEYINTLPTLFRQKI
jgi:arsenate reductase (thioredoxin)